MKLLLFTMAAAFCAGWTAPPAIAQETFHVDTLRYRNDGAYYAEAAVAYRDGGGFCLITRAGRISAGNTVDFKIGGQNGMTGSALWGSLRPSPRSGSWRFAHNARLQSAVDPLRTTAASPVEIAFPRACLMRVDS